MKKRELKRLHLEMMKEETSMQTQDVLMHYDPATGQSQPFPSHARQWRAYRGEFVAWLYNPWTGEQRSAYDVGKDMFGRKIVPEFTDYPKGDIRRYGAEEAREVPVQMKDSYFDHQDAVDHPTTPVRDKVDGYFVDGEPMGPMVVDKKGDWVYPIIPSLEEVRLKQGSTHIRWPNGVLSKCYDRSCYICYPPPLPPVEESFTATTLKQQDEAYWSARDGGLSPEPVQAPFGEALELLVKWVSSYQKSEALPFSETREFLVRSLTYNRGG